MGNDFTPRYPPGGAYGPEAEKFRKRYSSGPKKRADYESKECGKVLKTEEVRTYPYNKSIVITVPHPNGREIIHNLVSREPRLGNAARLVRQKEKQLDTQVLADYGIKIEKKRARNKVTIDLKKLKPYMKIMINGELIEGGVVKERALDEAGKAIMDFNEAILKRPVQEERALALEQRHNSLRSMLSAEQEAELMQIKRDIISVKPFEGYSPSNHSRWVETVMIPRINEREELINNYEAKLDEIEGVEEPAEEVETVEEIEISPWEIFPTKISTDGFDEIIDSNPRLPEARVKLEEALEKLKEFETEPEKITRELPKMFPVLKMNDDVRAIMAVGESIKANLDHYESKIEQAKKDNDGKTREEIVEILKRDAGETLRLIDGTGAVLKALIAIEANLPKEEVDEEEEEEVVEEEVVDDEEEEEEVVEEEVVDDEEEEERPGPAVIPLEPVPLPRDVSTSPSATTDDLAYDPVVSAPVDDSTTPASSRSAGPIDEPTEEPKIEPEGPTSADLVDVSLESTPEPEPVDEVVKNAKIREMIKITSDLLLKGEENYDDNAQKMFEIYKGASKTDRNKFLNLLDGIKSRGALPYSVKKVAGGTKEERIVITTKDANIEVSLFKDGRIKIMKDGKEVSVEESAEPATE